MYDPYAHISKYDILNELQSIIDKQIISRSGHGFEYVHKLSCINLLFTEVYVNCGIFNLPQLSGESIEKKSKPQLKKVKAAIRQLPKGISAELIPHTLHNASNRIEYLISLKVSSDYAYAKFVTFCTGSIIHDPNTSTSFKDAALQFSKQVKSNHPDALKNIIIAMRNSLRTNSCLREPWWRVDLTGVFWDDYQVISFKKLGLVPLSSLNQAYGLACCLAESISSEEEGNPKYQLEKGPYFISMHKYCPKQIELPLDNW